MQAIPAIDLIDGQVVRLLQGDFTRQTSYDRDPVAYAKAIEQAGLDCLHLVDLSGARSGKPVHIELLQEICSRTSLKIDFGGGVKTQFDLEAILAAGASQVVIGSLCVSRPELVQSWIGRYGTERLVLALDIDGTTIRINGWQDGSGKTLDEVLEPFVSYSGLTILTTDIRKDGTGAGPNVELYGELVRRYPNFRWIASGGVESMNDLRELRSAGCAACVVGKALLEGKIALQELKSFNDEYDL